jgi:hypothetical protein
MRVMFSQPLSQAQKRIAEKYKEIAESFHFAVTDEVYAVLASIKLIKIENYENIRL